MSELSESFWTELPLGRGVELLTCDANGVAALSKPAGVLSHPNEAADLPRSLLTTHYNAATECYEWSDAAGVKQKLWLLNRLDSATSGAILVAADEALAREIRAQFKRRKIQKIYQALVFGVPRPAREIWRDRLAVVKKAGQIRTAAGAGFMPAECTVKLLRMQSGSRPISLVQLEPHTGRSHQLRVQCAKRHLPIVGDQTYGDFARNREFAKLAGTKRMFLHSLETAFSYEWRGQSFSFTAKAALPGEFVKFL